MIQIKDENGCVILFESWRFPTGEQGLKLPLIDKTIEYTICTHYESDEDILLSLFAVNAIQEQGANVKLHFPYLPYSRQDRVCSAGESFSLRVLASVLNSTGIQVYTDDIHNESTMIWFNKLNNQDQASCSANLPVFDALIAPDKGAAKKIMKNYQVKACVPVITLNKQRIGRDIVYMNHEFDTIKGEVCVVDDLCDGGGTFISLAKMLQETQPGITKLSLYVTHGFFTKGIDVLKQHYNDIYVYNLYNQEYTDSVNTLKGN